MSSDSIGLSADRDEGVKRTNPTEITEPRTSADSKPDAESTYEGSEPIFSVFMQAQVNLQTTRLTIKDRVVQNVSDLVAEMELARREFLHLGHATKAIQDVKRIGTTLDQRAQDWNRSAQALERDTRNMSGNEAKRMRAEHSRIRTAINVLNRYFTKLEVELNQIAANQLVDQKNRQLAGGTNAEPETARADENQTTNSQPGHRPSDADGVAESKAAGAFRSAVGSLGVGGLAVGGAPAHGGGIDEDLNATTNVSEQDVMTRLGEYDTAELEAEADKAAGNWKSVTEEEEDQTPGRRIDLSIYNDLDIEQVEGYQALCEIIGEGLPISYDRCSRKILGGGDAREHAWDYGTKMSIAARWIPVVDTPFLDAVFFLWLIPKKSDIARDLHYALGKFRLCFSNDKLWQELEFKATRPDGVAVPQNKKIRALMEKANEIIRGSGDMGDNFFLAHVPLANGIRSEFFLSIENMQ